MDRFVRLQKIVPQKLITCLAGILASTSWPFVKNFLISRFINAYDVDMSEAKALSISQYETFNDFFTRELKQGARPVAQDEYSIVSPADGAISELGVIHQGEMLQAKGINYSVARLLGDEKLASELEGGAFATVYLSPKDYHRVHMPVSGEPLSLKYIPGKLFSVNQRTAENLDSLFARNERLVATFKQGQHCFVVVLVGAMIVGGMETVLTGPVSRGKEAGYLDFEQQPLGKGAELGRFYLGSTAIMLFPETMGVAFKQGLSAGDKVQMGENLASLVGHLTDKQD